MSTLRERMSDGIVRDYVPSADEVLLMLGLQGLSGYDLARALDELGDEVTADDRRVLERAHLLSVAA